MDSDGSFEEWQQSSKYHRSNHTLERPNLAQKRKNPNDTDACNRTFLIKRPRVDGPMEIDMEIENEPSIQKGNINEATNPQIEDEDEIEENNDMVKSIEETQASIEAKGIKDVSTSKEVNVAKKVKAANEIDLVDDCLVST